MSISFSGLASGLDTASWVTSLTQLKRAKVTNLEQQKATLVSAQNTLSSIRSFFSSFRSTIEKITDSKFNVSNMNIFSKKVAASSNLAILSATAKSNAAEGSYEVNVKQTATQTQVKSGYRYKTTLISTTQAKTDSYLANIGIGYGTDTTSGIKAGQISIYHNQETHYINIDASETMDTFLAKLHQNSINAAFDNDTGIFSIDVNVGDINDIGGTGILQKLKINNINYGYTGNRLEQVEEHEVYHQATNDTLLSDLGVHVGTISIQASDGTYEVILDADDTIGDLVSELRTQSIDATFNDGVFAINNAYITDDGTTNLINAFGITSPDISSQTQSTEGLKYQTVWTETTTALGSTLLKDVNGVDLSTQKTIKVQNKNGVKSTITVDATTTLDGNGDANSLVSKLRNAGLNVTFEDGTLNISDGWIITGGTFDVESAFGLSYTAVAATETGDALTVTTTTVSGATKQTKLKDLTNAVTSGNIDVTDTSNQVHHLSINNNWTIDQFLGQIRGFGLGAEFDETTGVLTLTGGDYAAAANGGTPASNMLNVFFGSNSLDASSVDSATSTSAALKETITHTHAAQGTDTLGTLGMTSGTYNATFRTGTTDVTVQINQNTTLDGLAQTLRDNGIDAQFDAQSGKFTIAEGEFVGVSGGNFNTLMNFTSTITGRYTTSNTVQAQTVTSGQEMSSAGVVYQTVLTTTTVTHTIIATAGQASTGEAIEYEVVTTTVVGHTEGISQTGAALGYTSVTTTGTAQTGQVLSYDTVNETLGSTVTVAQTLTSQALTTDVTAGQAQTGAVLTYNEVTTTGVSITGPTLYYQETSTVESTTSITMTIQCPQAIAPSAKIDGSEHPATLEYIQADEIIIGVGGATVQRPNTASVTQTSGVLTYSGTTTVYTGLSTAGQTLYNDPVTSCITQTSGILTYTTTQPSYFTTTAISQTGMVVTIDGYSGRARTATINATCTWNGVYTSSNADGFKLNTVLGLTGTHTIGITNSQGNTVFITTTTSTTWGSFKSSLTTNGIAVNDYISLGQAANFGGGGKGGGLMSSEYALAGTVEIGADGSGSYISSVDELVIGYPNATPQASNIGVKLGMVTDVNIGYGTHVYLLNSATNDGSIGAATTFAQVGINSTCVLTQTDGQTLTIKPSNTISSTFTLSGGRITTNNAWSYIPPEISSVFGIGYGEGVSYQSVYHPETTTTTLANENTTASQMGLTANAKVIFSDGSTLTVQTTDTLTSIAAAFTEHGVSTTIPNLWGMRALTISADSTNAIVSMTPQLASILNINYGEGISYSVTPATTVSGGTFLSNLGINSNGSVQIMSNDGTITTVNVPRMLTINAFVSAVNAATNGNGNILEYTNGQLRTVGNNNYAIAGMSQNLLNAFGITLGEGASYIGTQQPTVLTADSSTTLADLGFSGTGQIVTALNGINSDPIIVDSNTTLGDIITALTSAHVNATLNANGTIEIKAPAGNNTAYIESISPNLGFALGLESGEGYSYSIGTVNVPISAENTWGDLGFVGTGEYTVLRLDGLIEHITIHDTDTLGEAGPGQNGYYFDECIRLLYPNEGVITKMSDNLKSFFDDKFGYQISENSTYYTNFGEYINIEDHMGSTLQELMQGATPENIFIELKDMMTGDITTLNADGTKTLGEIKDWLCGYSIDLHDEGGLVQIVQDGKYAVDSMSLALQELLGLKGCLGEEKSYSTTPVQLTYNQFMNYQLSELGLTGNATITFEDNSTVTINANSSLSSLNQNNTFNSHAQFGGYGLSILLQGKNGHSIKNMSSNLEALLGIDAGYGESYLVSTQVNTTQTEIGEENANDFTYAQLGMSGNSGIMTLKVVNDIFIVTIAADCTLGQTQDRLDEVASGKFTFSINSEGVSIECADDTAILSISSNLASVLGIEAGYGISYNVNDGTYTAGSGTYLSTLGFTGSGRIVAVNGNNRTTIDVSSTGSIGSVITALTNADVNATLNPNGTVEIKTPAGNKTGYIESMSSNLASLLGIEAGEGYSYGVTSENATLANTLAKIGLQGNSAIIYTKEGAVTVAADRTLSQVNEALGDNYTLNINDGTITISATAGHYITGMSANLAALLGAQAGEGYSYNVNESGSTYNTTTHTATAATNLSDLGFTGTGKIVAVNGNTRTTINISATDDTVGSIITALTNAGVNATLNADGTVEIKTPEGNKTAYIESMTSNIANFLGMEGGMGYSYGTSSASIDATTATTLGALGFDSHATGIIRGGNGYSVALDANSSIQDVLNAFGSAGVTATLDEDNHYISIAANGSNYIESISPGLAAVIGLEYGENRSYTVIGEETDSSIKKATTSDTMGDLGMKNNGYIITNNGTFTVKTTDSIGSIISALTNDFDITASYNTVSGQFTIGANGQSNYVTSMSANLSSVLGNLSVGNDYTYYQYDTHPTEQVVTTTPTAVTGTDKFGTLGVSGTHYLVLGDNDRVTITADTTMQSFINDMNSKGFNVTLTNGIFNIQSTGSNFIKTDTDNMLEKLNIVGSTYSTVEKTLGNTKLKDLKDSDGNLLNITSGNIQVYKNGVARTLAIDNEMTLDELSSVLSDYNIQMIYSSGNEGRIYFTGDGNSYLKAIAGEGATNLLNRLGASTWTQVKDSSSKALEYTTNDNEVINSSTKLVNLKNASGNSLGITTGKYKIVANGISYEGTITNATTVNDFFTDLSRYGISGSISSDGKITLNTSNDDTYLQKANGQAGYSTIVDTLFSDWTFGNIYVADPVDVTTSATVNMTSETRLKDIDQGTFTAGKFVVKSNTAGSTLPQPDDVVLELSENATVGDFMAAISYYGFNAYIENGSLIVRNDGTRTLANYATPSERTNVLELLGLDSTTWEKPGYYTGTEQTKTDYHTALRAVTRETKLSELRDADGNSLGITTGEYYLYSNGVRHTMNLTSTDITLDQFMNKLAEYGINTIFDTDGTQSTLKLVGSGDSYVETASTANASNVIDQLFNNTKSTLYSYEGYEQTTEIVTTTAVASLSTMLSDYDNGDNKSEGIFAVTVDGNYHEINITSYETYGSLLEKFERIGVNASLNDGVLRLETGNREFVVDESRTTSKLLSNLDLHFSDNLGGFAASSDAVTQTTTTVEDRTLSVAKYADYDTQISLLNISSGTLSIYRNGAKQLINIDNTETFDDLRTKIHNAFGDVDIDFVNGRLRFFSTSENVDVQVGSSNDTSNMSSICGFSQDENGYIVSARELYKVNASSVIMTEGLFRNGDVTEGTFTIGDQEFSITNTTTLQGIIAQINSSEKSNASAYWDSVDGKLVITSRATGASIVNIEAGTSNFTDILGLTSSEWNNDGSVSITRVLRDAQEIGNNAKFTINGTSFSSASNVITSDVSRIQGLTLNLKGASMGETVTINVSKDTEAVTEAVGEFVESYNELVENVDAELAKGELKDQSTLKFIKQQIRNLLVNSFGGATTFRNLAALGISTNSANAGNISTSAAGVEFLYFDAEKFMEGYNKDADAVRNMLVGSDQTPGILLQIENIVENALTTGSGYFSSADKTYSQKISTINEKIKKANESIEAYRARLESKFKSMDSLIAQMQNQYNSFLSSGGASVTSGISSLM